jgi:hypothetical protein
MPTWFSRTLGRAQESRHSGRKRVLPVGRHREFIFFEIRPTPPGKRNDDKEEQLPVRPGFLSSYALFYGCNVFHSHVLFRQIDAKQ